jgi:integrase
MIPRAHRLVLPSTGAVSWTVIGDDGLPIGAADSFLVYLDARELSPNTVRTYAHGLALFFRFLDEAGLDWPAVRLVDLAEFIGWLRRPAPNVIVLDAAASVRRPRTVNKILASVSSFYDYQVRNGCDVADQLVVWRHIAARRYKPFLHHATRSKPLRTSALRLREDRRHPKTLTTEEMQALLDGCRHLRDRLLLSLLHETGMRIGQALGLRHEDLRTWAGELMIVPRSDNANGARSKSRSEHLVHISVALGRLYSDYMHVEYGDLDSDYVFVNLWGGTRGRPLTYAGVHRLVRQLRAGTGVWFTPHMLRHTHATDLLRAGVRLDIASRRLTHSSVATTADTYSHLDADDIRAALAPYWAAKR